MVEPGWQRIGPDPAILAWAKAAQAAARTALATSPEPWRCGGTWFVGVDALPNGPDGAIGGTAFPWHALPLLPEPLHPAQLSVWEGSHAILRTALLKVLSSHPAETWGDIDITDAYQQARRDIFATCRRITLPARPGEATLLHRLTLHGVAPWKPGDSAPPEGRMIAYLRPQLARVQPWLTDP